MIKNNLILIVFLILSFTLHFAYLDYPAEVVFDEVHFGKFASSYMTGQFHFDIHPPLGKLFLAFGGRLSGFKPVFGFNNIGEKFPDANFLGLRFFPALAGSLMPLVVYLIIRKLGGSKKTALLGMFMVVFESALLIQSRFILIDSFLLLFGLLGILFYLVGREQDATKNKIISLCLSGLFLGASFSVKWTGLVFWFLVLILSLPNLASHLLPKGQNKKRAASMFILFILAIPFAVYTAVFAIHFSLLPYSGAGDAFMSQKFQSILVNNANYNHAAQMGFFEKFMELNRVMLSANSGISTPHPYGIKWYTMPLMDRSLYYWTRTEQSGYISRIYLLGNPMVWWSIFPVIVGFAGAVLFNIGKRKSEYLKSHSLLIAFLLVYLLNIFTYAFISRVIFLYHYFPSLVLGIIMFCVLADRHLTGGETKTQSKKQKIIFWGFAGGVLLLFLFFSPLTFGTPLDKAAYELRVWTQSWV